MIVTVTESAQYRKGETETEIATATATATERHGDSEQREMALARDSVDRACK